MKKILSIIAVMALTLSVGLAVDYSHHMYNQRTYRVALGAGNAPSAADMALVRLHNGDTVLNTDDNILYIMTETNKYIKIESDGALTVDAIISGIGSGITGVALDTEVWGEAGIVESTNLLVNTVAIQAKDIAAGDLSGYRVLHVWISETDVGVASTNNIETLALSTGTEISEVTAEADYWYATTSNGTAVATVTATAAGTNYLMVVDGSVISSAALTFE